MINKVARTLLPPMSKRRQRVKKILVRLGLINPKVIHSEYRNWLAGQQAAINFEQAKCEYQPLISIVVPCYNTPEEYLKPLIYSVTNQLYENWELVLVDASDNPNAKAIIKDATNIDVRIRITHTPNNGISANTNKGIEIAKGEFIAFLDHDDTLEENALSEVVVALNTDRSIDLFYSDEDKLSAEGDYVLNPHFKPDFSPDLLRNVNYITHFVVARRSLVKKVRSLNPDRDGAQDYDLLLRLVDAGAKVYHIPRVLYHWRQAKNSTAHNFSIKEGVLLAGVRSLQDHLKRNKAKGKVEVMEGRPGFYRIRYELTAETTLAFIIYRPPFSNIPDQLIELIQKQHPTAEIFTNRLGESEKNDDNITFIDHVHTGEELVNKVGSRNNSDVTFVALSAALPRHDDLNDLLATAAQPSIFAVAPLVVSNENKVVDGGVVEFDQVEIPLFQGYQLGENTAFGDVEWVRNVTALTGNVFAIKTEHLKDFKHTNTWFKSQASSAGLYNTVWSHCVWEHLGNTQPIKPDGFFNPNLSLKKVRFSVKGWAGVRDE